MKIIINSPEEKRITYTKEFEIESTCGIFANVYIIIENECDEYMLEYLSVDMGQVSPAFSMNDVMESYDECIRCVKKYLKTHNIKLPDTNKHTKYIIENYHSIDDYNFCIERNANNEYNVFNM